MVTNARLLGAAAEGPVELSLQPTGGGFRFGTGSGTSQPSQRSDSLISFLAKKVVKLLLAHEPRRMVERGGANPVRAARPGPCERDPADSGRDAGRRCRSDVNPGRG